MRWLPFSSSSRRKGQVDPIVATRTALIVWKQFSAWSNTMLLGDWKTSSLTSRPLSMPVSSMISRPMFLGDHQRAAVELAGGLGAIGWGGAKLRAVRMLIDADVGAFHRRAARARRSGARPRLAHRGPLSGNRRDGLYLDAAWRGCMDLQQPNQRAR